MKNIIVVLGLVALCGCAAFQSGIYDEEVVPQTNVVTVVKVQTNEFNVPIFETNRVEQVTYSTNLVVKPGVEKGINMAGDLVPFPGGDIAAGVIGLALAGYASWHNRRNQKKSRQIVGTLVDNIGAARKVIKTLPNGKEVDAEISHVIKSLQDAEGVREDIHRVVKEKRANPHSPVE